ncbi:MAG: hypothetical protein C0506_07080 [Anaerolinea sp.]|nr:hypothetical protein [Anaerolinea sp.]
MDPRLVQLARILNTPLESAEAARVAVSARFEDVAEALVLEAAASDDVTSGQSALEYLEGRLLYLGEILEPAAAARIRDRFRARTASW